MFGSRRPPDDDEPEYVGPDDAREWRTEAEVQRRTNAELLRVKRQMDAYRAMEKVWEEIQRNLQDYRDRMKWTDDRAA